MTREELIKQCRYYNGEEECPYKDQNKSMLWFYENCWVNEQTNDDNIGFDAGRIYDYKELGLESFEAQDNIPISLKALLFDRFAKWCYSRKDAIEPFMHFYKKYYY